jgi:hypothetical protein
LSVNDVMIGIGIGVATTVITTGITFYIKDYLKEQAKFRKFRARLEQIAGKNAQVMIPQIGQVKISDINKEGIVVESPLLKTFIPIDKVFQTEISLPVENYEKLAKELMVKNTKETFDLIFPLIIDKFKEVFMREFLEEGSELNAVVALQIKTQLKKEGYVVEDKSGEKSPTFRQIINHIDKKDKQEKKKRDSEETQNRNNQDGN